MSRCMILSECKKHNPSIISYVHKNKISLQNLSSEFLTKLISLAKSPFYSNIKKLILSLFKKNVKINPIKLTSQYSITIQTLNPSKKYS